MKHMEFKISTTSKTEQKTTKQGELSWANRLVHVTFAVKNDTENVNI